MWIILTLLSAITFSLVDILSKFALKWDSLWKIIFVKIAYSTPFLLPILLFIDIPDLSANFWKFLLITIPLEIAAHILYLKSISYSPLSLTIPFLSLTPVAILLTSWIILGETPSIVGGLGVLCVTLGAYILNADLSRRGWFEPVRAIFSEKGTIIMVVVAMIFSFTAPLGKKLILESSPLFFAATYFPMVGAVFYPLFYSRIHTPDKKPRTLTYIYIAIGIAWAISTVAHFLAVKMIEVAYFVSVKRLSLVFSTLAGLLIFGESHFKSRIAGVLVMFCGVVLISIWG